jgi:hypothetical protein
VSSCGYDIVYECEQPTPMILTLKIHYSRMNDVMAPDHVLTDPAVLLVAYRDGFGNWCRRIVAPRGDIRIFADGSTCISAADGIPSTPATTFLASGASSLHAAATLPTSRWSPPSDRASSRAFWCAPTKFRRPSAGTAQPWPRTLAVNSLQQKQRPRSTQCFAASFV